MIYSTAVLARSFSFSFSFSKFGSCYAGLGKSGMAKTLPYSNFSTTTPYGPGSGTG